MKRSINDFFVSKVICKVNSNVTINGSDILVSNSKLVTAVPDKDEQNIILRL